MAVVASLAAVVSAYGSAKPNPKPSKPTFTSAATTAFTVGSAGSFAITTNRLATIAEAGRVPPGLTFSSGVNGGATIAGTPDSGTGGRYILTLMARNSAGLTSEQFILVVDEPPSLAKVGDRIWVVGGKYDNTPIVATGYPPPAITEAGALPEGMTFQSYANGTAVIYGSPSLTGSPGACDITITATNSAGSATKSISIRQYTIFSVILGCR